MNTLLPAATGRLDILPMTESDVPDVMRLERSAFTTTWPPDAFLRELRDNKLAYYYVGRIDGELAAFGGIWVILEDSHVTTIAVDPERRGRKLGETMLRHLVQEAMSHGASWMTLEVRESNVVAQSLYRKYGFATVSMRRAYYSDNGENALVMWAGSLKSQLFRNRLDALATLG